MTETSSWKQKLLAGMAALALIGAAACARAADSRGQEEPTARPPRKPQRKPRRKKRRRHEKGRSDHQDEGDRQGLRAPQRHGEEGSAGHAGHHAHDRKTCATEIVIDDYGVNTKLPLNTAVNVTFTPKAGAQVRLRDGQDDRRRASRFSNRARFRRAHARVRKFDARRASAGRVSQGPAQASARASRKHLVAGRRHSDFAARLRRPRPRPRGGVSPKSSARRRRR